MPYRSYRSSLQACRLSLLLLLSLFVAVASAQAAQGPAWGLIVKLKPPAGSSSLESRAAAAQATAAEAPQAVRERLAQVLGERLPGMQAQRLLANGSYLVDGGRVLEAEEAQALAERLAADPRVEYVVPNVRERRQQAARVEPNDPFYPEQWWLQPRTAGLNGVPDLPAAWARSTGSPSVVVAVLDSGVTAHPELDAQLLPGYDFISDVRYSNDGNGRDNDPSDPGDFVLSDDGLAAECETGNSSWHGTRIAGQIAALSDNRLGVASVAPQVRILPVRVSGKCGAAVADIVDAMAWAVGLPVPGVPLNPNPARIVNLSFGGNGVCNAAYVDAIARLRERGALLVTAAGNEGQAVTRPGNCPGDNVITVGALNQEGFKASYANLGPEVTLSTVGGDGFTGGVCDDLLADSGLLTLDNSGLRQPGAPDYARVGGTSFSTPIVSGVAALMLAVNPNLSVEQLRDGLVRTVQPHVQVPGLGECSLAGNTGRCSCTATTCGSGILDAGQALVYAAAPQFYQPPLRLPAQLDNEDIRACAARLDAPVPEQEPAPTISPDERGDDGGGALDMTALGLLALLAGGAAWLRRRPQGRP